MISSLLILGSLFLGTAATSPLCLSGDSCFPSKEVLSAFNNSINGKLHIERPAGAPCYHTDPAYNATACAAITQNYQDDQWREDVFGALEQINWETCTSSDACLIPPNSNGSTCGQGSIPSYSVHATSSADVVNYVKFVTKYNLRIVIKNTGHDYAGRSSGKGGFGLWTHGMQGISRDKSFVPAGCHAAPHDAVTIAAGVQWSIVYQYADDNDIIIIGGDSPHVGAAGGWTQGGGHSILSQAHGLGVDNLLQATIVTADGVEYTVNECQYSDLFWAIRGGGPGTWGIVTSITYKAHPSVPVAWVSIASTAASIDDNYKLVQNFVQKAPYWADLGGGAYINIFPKLFTFIGIIPNATTTELKKGLPILPAGSSVNYTESPSFFSFFKETFDTGVEVVGINFAASSRLIPRKYFETDAAGVAAAIRKGQTFLGSSADTQPIQVLVDTPAPRFQKNETSVTPVWYDSLWHVVYTTAWPNNATVAQQRKDIDGIHQSAQVLREFAPDGGAYINEADVYEPNHEASFWGTANAARLKQIKAKYDPKNVFQVWQGIGWAGATDVRYECYSQLNPGDASLVN